MLLDSIVPIGVYKHFRPNLIANIFNYFGFGCFLRQKLTPMYVHAEGQAVGKDTWSGGAQQSGAHRRSERCAHTKTSVHTHMEECVHCSYRAQCVHIHGAVCAYTKTSVHTYMEQCVHCTYMSHCAHTQVEIVVVWSSDGADVVLSLGRGSETGWCEQLKKQINPDESFPKKG